MDQQFTIIATAKTPSGAPISMGVAAAGRGYDHFNYIQTFTADTAASNSMTAAGTPPLLPYVDPPPGGWANLPPPYDPDTSSNGASDSWPFYYDEYYYKHMSSPMDPEYLYYYTLNNTLDVGGNVSPDSAYGLVFYDDPCTGFNDAFEAQTLFVGVTGTGCNVPGIVGVLSDPTSNCSWSTIPEAGWSWSLRLSPPKPTFQYSPLPGP
jgi:hypothetical protein